MWIAILHDKIKAGIATTRGVHTGTAVVKYVMAGADAVMVTSALLKHGPDYANVLLNELEQRMERREYKSVEQMKGSMSQKSVANPSAFTRGNYIKILESYKSPYTS